MSEYDKIIYGFLFSLTGIAFGWFLNFSTQWLNNRKGDKKQLKIAIYNLLETYNLLTRLNIKPIIDKVVTKTLAKTGQSQDNSEIRQFLTEMYTVNFNTIYRGEFIEELKCYEEKYNNAIIEISGIDPITAYNLNGRTKFQKIIELINKSIPNLEEQIKDKTGDDVNIDSKILIEFFEGNLLGETLDKIEEALIDLSKKVGLIEKFRMKKTISQIKSYVNEGIDDKIEELFEMSGSVFNQT